ncbi:glycosyltransferase [Flavobacteriaceae bacterium LMO-SS05]
MTNHSRHIVLLTPGFPKNKDDTTVIPALQVYVKSLINLNPSLKIQIITFQYPFSSNKYDWNGITVFPLNGKNNKLQKIFIWLKAFSLLKKIHHLNPIDCIHSFWIGECSFIGEKFAIKRNIKHIVTAMGQDVLEHNRYTRLLSKNNSTIITLCKRHNATLKQHCHLDSQIIPWGIDINEFPEIKDKTIDILGVGSLNDIKNYALFIEIIEKLNKKVKHLHVVIIGEGPLKPTLEACIKEKQMQKVIALTGALPRHLVLDKMSKSNILLHTSRFESFGYVFLEALYSGMHIVSFNVGLANNSLMWKTCQTENKMIDSLLKMLSVKVKGNRNLLHTVEETALTYSKIYNE